MDRSISAHKGLEPFALTSCPAHINKYVPALVDLYNGYTGIDNVTGLSHENDTSGQADNIKIIKGALEKFYGVFHAEYIFHKLDLNVGNEQIADIFSKFVR
ncbi:hypothetical protein Bandiella_00780 [Candidatus Bandiella woodruffii]|uniref:Uncharacterized protein n=2 Tax=Candidatus Bandiella euplotis TaxID=1664265 RepID=A0ABZ0UMC8_9RICK|nr:hypothetical protein Bandiella_00780 [Candidatus Bandiella woodruffii]